MGDQSDDRAAMLAVVKAAANLNAHVEAMQGMCSRYLEPNGYYIDRDDTIWRGDPVEAEAFISDMIYMLDGPEQREAQGALTTALADLDRLNP